MRKKGWNRLGVFLAVCLLAAAIGGIVLPAVPVQAAQPVKLAAPKLKDAVCTSSSSIRLTWRRVNRADGYAVYIRQAGQWKWRKNVSGRNTTQCVIDKLTYGKTYRFTVRAFDERGKTRVKGDYDKKGLKKSLKFKSKYVDGYKFFYDEEGNRIEDVSDLIGENPSYELRVNTQACVVTVYAKDGDNGYTIPIKAFLCSPGANMATESGKWSIGQKYRFHTLFGAYGQWSVRIHDGILFHSELYSSYGTNNTMNVTEYNKLGTAVSHGCIRLQCSSVKWIYDNCPTGTPVVIYRAENAGPLGKPELEKLPAWHTWDPTDPTAVDYCRQHGCHGQ
ncbi:MAG: L,D-transpeptidase family protein [Lachnospiraceae bacterium]|nr:L,D-transpeptidase family protein [Lachnospiraceae bacterium]